MYQCPKCQTREYFKVYAVQRVCASIDSLGDVFDDVPGDLEWENTSAIQCGECGHVGQVKEFYMDKTEA